MSVQVNIRLDDELAEQVDKLAAEEGMTRAAIVRTALLQELVRRRERQIAEQYRKAYTEFPQTDEELRRAEMSARRAIAEEPWETWW
jgi:metal-responsive CopG/Arc/MetJ family transcriptional regulator